MASGQRPTPVGWYEPPLYGRTLSIAVAFVSGCLIAFLLGSYTAVRPQLLCVVLIVCVLLSSKQMSRGEGLAAVAVHHVGWVLFTKSRRATQYGPC